MQRDTFTSSRWQQSEAGVFSPCVNTEDTSWLHKQVSAPQPGRGCALLCLCGVCVCTLRRVFWKCAGGGRRWARAAGLCILSVSLAGEADTLIKPYLESILLLLLLVPSEAASLTPYRTDTHVVVHMLDCVCVHPPQTGLQAPKNTHSTLFNTDA